MPSLPLSSSLLGVFWCADPEPTSTPPLAPTTAAAASAEDDNSTSSSTNAPAANSPTSAVSASRASPAAELKTLEDRIAFLELELLKQSVVPTSTPSWASGAGADTASRSKAGTAGGFNSAAAAAAALNPAAAGAGGLSAAAAAAASRWNADSTLYRQQPRQGTTMMMAGGVAGGIQDPSAAASDAVVISTQLAAAAELGQLDPDVYALAEALAVRQGFAAMQPAAIPQQPGLFGGGSFGGYLSPQQQMMQMQMQQQPQPPHQHGVRRPASIWGRSVHHSRPLSANTWGGVGQQYPLYDPTSNTTNMGEPLLSQRDFEEDVPYNPSGWAIAGTIVTVYLGVIVTFLAMCVGDMPY